MGRGLGRDVAHNLTPDRTVRTVPGAFMARARRFAALSLVGLHAALLAWGAERHSPAWDETGHLVGGISHWHFGTFDLYRANPPLIRVLATAPVMLALPITNWRGYEVGVGVRPEQTARRTLVAVYGPRVFWVHTLARWACIPFSLLGAYVCFSWARGLYGPSAGILATALWCFSPNIIGHGSLITPDAGATAMGVAAAYLFWRWLKRPTWGRAVGAGLVLGLAELTKTTWIVLFGLWPVLWVVWRATEPKAAGKRERGKGEESAECTRQKAECRMQNAERTWGRGARQMAVILLLGLYVLNLGYGFEGSFQRLGDYGFVSEMLGGPKDGGETYQPEARNRFAGAWLGGVPVPLPKNYVMGIDLQKSDFENKMWSYLRGEWRLGGWWYYYLYALAIKEPLGTWVLVFLAAGVSLWPGGRCPPAIARPSPLAPGPSPLAPREVVATEVATPQPSTLNPQPSPLTPRQVVATEVATPRSSPHNPSPRPHPP